MDSSRTCEVVMFDQDGTSQTHNLVMISSLQPFVLGKRSKLWKECFIGDVLTKTPHILPSCCSPQGRRLHAQVSGILLISSLLHAQLVDSWSGFPPLRFPYLKPLHCCEMKTPREVRWSWSRIHLHNYPRQLLLLPHAHYQERKTLSLRIRIGPSKPETGWTNQVGAGVLPISPESEAMSQWLMCCDRLITMTDMLCQLVSRKPSYSSFPFPFFFLWRGETDPSKATLEEYRGLSEEMVEFTFTPKIQSIYRWRWNHLEGGWIGDMANLETKCGS